MSAEPMVATNYVAASNSTSTDQRGVRFWIAPLLAFGIWVTLAWNALLVYVVFRTARALF
jgi:hypothetical protein